MIRTFKEKVIERQKHSIKFIEKSVELGYVVKEAHASYKWISDSDVDHNLKKKFDIALEMFRITILLVGSNWKWEVEREKWQSLIYTEKPVILVLYLSSNKYYVGHTKNLRRRLIELGREYSFSEVGYAISENYEGRLSDRMKVKNFSEYDQKFCAAFDIKE